MTAAELKDLHDRNEALNEGIKDLALCVADTIGCLSSIAADSQRSSIERRLALHVLSRMAHKSTVAADILTVCGDVEK